MVNGGSVSGGAWIWWLPIAGYGRGLRGDRLQGSVMAETVSCGSMVAIAAVRKGCVAEVVMWVRCHCCFCFLCGEGGGMGKRNN